MNAGETAKVAVEDNGHEVIPLEEFEEIKNNPNYSREQLEAIRRIPETIGSLNIVFKKNDKGQFIVCVPYSGNSCAPRSNERYANSQEVKQGFQDFALDVVPIPGGKGAAVVVKKTGQVVGKYKDVKAAKKAANDAVEKARVESNVYRDSEYGANWTSTKKLSSNTNFASHWQKHKNEFPNLKSPNDYYRFATDFVSNPPAGTLKKVRKNGDTILYNP